MSKAFSRGIFRAKTLQGMGEVICTVFSGNGVFSSIGREPLWRTYWSRMWDRDDYWGLIFVEIIEPEDFDVEATDD